MLRLINFLIDKLYVVKRLLIKDWRRAFRLFRQRFTQGFPDSDTWSLDFKIAQYVAPRLRRFKELNNGYPGDLTAEEWDDMLDDMIYAMEAVANEDDLDEQKNIDYKRMQRGLDLFGERFRGLWW